MQIVLPSILVWHFYVHSYRTGTQISLLWLGHNFLNISVYAADARARALPLLGGNRSGHDWHYMLTRLDILDLDATVALLFVALAVMSFGALLALPRFMD